MIQEGTDGLSRGIPLTKLRQYDGHKLLPLLWWAASPSFQLLTWTQQKIDTPWNTSTQWLFQTDNSDWSRSKMLQHNVLWCVTPSFGK